MPTPQSDWGRKTSPFPLVLLMVWTAAAQAPQPAQRRPDSPPPLQIAGRAVEATLTAVTEKTLRLSISPLDNSGTPVLVPNEPVIIKRNWVDPVLRLRSITGQQTVKAGGLVVTVVPDTLVFRIADSNGRVIQELCVEKESGTLRFALGQGPLLV